MFKLLPILEEINYKNKFISDENGNPIIFYHGTDRNFNKFEFKDSFRKSGAFGKLLKVKSGAIFFTPDKKLAATFAKDRAKLHNSTTKKVYKVNIELHNPLDLRELTNEKLYILLNAGFNAWDEFGVKDNTGFMYNETWQQWLIDHPDYDEELDESPEEWYYNIDNLNAEPSQFWEVADNIDVVNNLTKMGYDGLILLEYPNNSEAIAVFNPNKIKIIK